MGGWEDWTCGSALIHGHQGPSCFSFLEVRSYVKHRYSCSDHSEYAALYDSVSKHPLGDVIKEHSVMIPGLVDSTVCC